MITSPTQHRLHRTPMLGWHRLAVYALASSALAMLGSCAVASAVGTTASLLVSTVGLAADVTIGAAKVTGKAIGAAASAVTPSSHDE